MKLETEITIDGGDLGVLEARVLGTVERFGTPLEDSPGRGPYVKVQVDTVAVKLNDRWVGVELSRPALISIAEELERKFEQVEAQGRD